MRRFLVKALQNAGFEVISYDNGLSAYQRLREEPFELLLTDIVMPEMDGIELARRASELDPDIKIMFITGFAAVALNSDSAAPEERQGAFQAGPSARTRQRSAEDARRLTPRRRPAVLASSRGSRYDGAAAGGRFRARSSAEEHYLDMVGVTGSIPVAPTSDYKRLLPAWPAHRTPSKQIASMRLQILSPFVALALLTTINKQDRVLSDEETAAIGARKCRDEMGRTFGRLGHLDHRCHTDQKRIPHLVPLTGARS